METFWLPSPPSAFAFNQLVPQGAYQRCSRPARRDRSLVGFARSVSYQMVKDGKIDALVVQDPFKMG